MAQVAKIVDGPQDQIDVFLSPVKKPRAFAITIMNVGGTKGALTDQNLAKGQVTDIVTTGNIAQGQLTWVVNGQPLRIPFFFRMESGSWRVVWPPSPRNNR